MFKDLLLSPGTHRKRVVNKIDLIDTQRVGWRVSIDFEVPDSHLSTEVLIVPLAAVPLGRLTSFDIIDEVGASVPAVTREFESSLLTHVAALVFEDSYKRKPRADELKWLHGAVHFRNDLAAKCREALLASVKDDPDCSTWFWPLLDNFIDGGVICGLLRDAKAGDRRIIKLRFVGQTDDILRKYGNRAYRAVRGVLRQLALASDHVELSAADAAEPCSVHYEITAPRGLAFAGGYFVKVHSDDRRELISDATFVRPRSTLGHLYSGPQDCRDLDGAQLGIRLMLFPDPSGPIRRAATTAWWMFLAVTAAALLLPLIQARGHSTELGAGFLASSVGISAVVLASVDHAISWRLFRTARFLLATTALATGLAGTMILGVTPLNSTLQLDGSTADDISVGTENQPPEDQSSPNVPVARVESSAGTEQNTAEPLAPRIRNFCSNTIPPLNHQTAWSCIKALGSNTDATDTVENSRLGLLGRYRWTIVLLAYVPVAFFFLSRLYWISRERLYRRHEVSGRTVQMLSGVAGEAGRKLSNMSKYLADRQNERNSV